ncbi:MAG: Holliday junction resolvase RuvX [Balneolaceae bacterium]
MEKLGRLIGIDVGTKRVGIARTDLLRTSANSVDTYAPDEAINQIEEMATENGPIVGFVVGWPLTPGGYEADATHMVEKYLHKLKKRFPDIPVHLVDERFSSKNAVKTMIESGVPRKKRHQRGRIDQAAAALILQQFLETSSDV